MSCDIIETMPWQCGDKDCSQQWHKSNYWIDDQSETGYTVDTYSDGDHDEIDGKDLPSPTQVHVAWLEYSRYVAINGVDPLNEFTVKKTIDARQRWQFRLAASVIGIVLVAARRAGKVVEPDQLPTEVRDFLMLQQSGIRHVVEGISNKEEAGALGVKLGPWITESIVVKRPNLHYVRDLKRAARRHVKRG